MLNSELQLRHPPKHKSSRNLQYLLTNSRLLGQKTKSLEYCWRKLCPSLGRGTTIKQMAMTTANATGGNTHQPGAWGASQYHQKHLCTLPISPFPAQFQMLQGKMEKQTNPEAKLCMKGGRGGGMGHTKQKTPLMPVRKPSSKGLRRGVQRRLQRELPVKKKKSSPKRHTREKVTPNTHKQNG